MVDKRTTIDQTFALALRGAGKIRMKSGSTSSAIWVCPKITRMWPGGVLSAKNAGFVSGLFRQSRTSQPYFKFATPTKKIGRVNS